MYEDVLKIMIKKAKTWEAKQMLQYALDLYEYSGYFDEDSWKEVEDDLLMED